MQRALAGILLCIALAALGLWAGLALRPAAGPTGEEGAHAQDAGGAQVLAAQTLKNLGVVIGAARRDTFVRTRRVQAAIESRPDDEVAVTLPLGGVVTAVHARTGEVLAGGDPVLEFARDAIPRPKPEVTAELLMPISESVHEAAAALRTAMQRRDIAKRELSRLEGVATAGAGGGIPSVSRQRLIELEYEIERAEVETQNVRRELARHGLEQDEIEAVARGAETPPNPRLWRRVLEENALWTPDSTRLQACLPEAQRDLPWVIAAIGELTAVGALDGAVVQAFGASSALGAHFAEAAGLLLEGAPIGQVLHLAEGGALEPTARLFAPGATAPDFDVLELRVRSGERVSAGQVAARLIDPRRMWLRLSPLPGELPLVLRALEAGMSLSARPLVSESGPALSAIRLERVEADTVLATVENRILSASPGVRSWALRPGLRYLVDVPIERLEGRFVLPAGAVAERGPDLVVFRVDGEGFAAMAVEVEYRDERVAVIADDGTFFEGDPIVLDGAFALSLALEQKSAGSGGGGHGHAHN